MSHPPRLLLISALLLAGCSQRGDGRFVVDAGFEDAARPDTAPRVVPPSGCDPADPDDFSGCADAGAEPDAERPRDAGPRDSAAADAVVVDTGVDAGPPRCAWEGDCTPRCVVDPRAADPCDTLDSIPGGTLFEDTTWDGRFCVESTVGVAAGVTLRITAGSEVYFRRGALQTEGRIEAIGTEDAPILLSAAGVDLRPGAWRGVDIRLTEGGEVELRHVTVEWGSYGVGQWEHHSDRTSAGEETNALLRAVTLRYNGTGIIVDDNTDLADTTIVCNGTGINVAAEDPDPGPPIARNNLCDNRRYDVFAGQDGALMDDNYWCTT
ncbi:MAG: hypothetical protein GWN73_43985, partial [Actinobacteria bacterium]|nr:hypothetical protein [Actinomycetota bacterium]NIU71964.1 hypothetical protein [Actinomycetota bacterium]NIW33897.1 hypothetical protein [Actinomycetota bacterium]